MDRPHFVAELERSGCRRLTIDWNQGCDMLGFWLLKIVGARSNIYRAATVNMSATAWCMARETPLSTRAHTPPTKHHNAPLISLSLSLSLCLFLSVSVSVNCFPCPFLTSNGVL